MGAILVVILTLWLYPSLCLYIIAKKTKTQLAWMAWVPILRGFTFCRLVDVSLWNWSGVLLIFPFVPVIAVVFIWFNLPRIPPKLGINNSSRFHMLIPIVNYLFLGYLAFFHKAPENPMGKLVPIQ